MWLGVHAAVESEPQARLSSKHTGNEVTQRPKVMPDTDHISKDVFRLSVRNFIKTNLWKTILALTVRNFLAPFQLIEIIAIVLQWQLGWKESILQQFLNLHSGDNCNPFPAYYSLNLVLTCNLFSLTWKSTTIICHDQTMRQTWIYVAQNFQGTRNFLSSHSLAALACESLLSLLSGVKI